MIKFCNLFSGSSGNSTYMESDSTKILIDAGVSCQRITKALESIGVSFNDINAILITHEHSDHTKGLTTIAKKFNTPIFATSKTWTQMSSLNVLENCKNTFTPEENFEIGDLIIHPFSIPLLLPAALWVPSLLPCATASPGVFTPMRPAWAPLPWCTAAHRWIIPLSRLFGALWKCSWILCWCAPLPL